ncbi:MAG: four-carbon acid sugar kinase family protein [Bacteroidota bacterium]
MNKATTFSSLTPIDTHYQESIVHSGEQVLVVLDDDPTGTQTVHNVLVLTEWSPKSIEEAFREPLFYVLTNTRSLDSKDAYDRIHNICMVVRSTALKVGKKFIIITRGDSTLRGHFKTETQAVLDAIKLSKPLTIFVPAYFDGGRFTIENTHYVEEGEALIPASETPFSKDKTFGYHSSELYDYIVEKDTRSGIRDNIFDLSIDEIRTRSLDYLIGKLHENQEKYYLIINAADPSDLNKVAALLLRYHSLGGEYIIRSAASLVSSLAGIKKKPFLTQVSMNIEMDPGLIVVGSYVPKSTKQLEFLLANNELDAYEIDVSQLVRRDRDAYITERSQQISTSMSNGKDCVMFTSRKLISGNDATSSLSIVNQVSEGIIRILLSITVIPSFIITKGGITSSDVATKVIKIKKALVMGQLIAGVPVWKPLENQKYGHIPYVIFPGNVGNKESLSQAFQNLKRST